MVAVPAVHFALKERNLGRLREVAMQVSAPGHSSYGQHLTAEQGLMGVHVCVCVCVTRPCCVSSTATLSYVAPVPLTLQGPGTIRALCVRVRVHMCARGGKRSPCENAVNVHMWLR